jgi:hypothetical protein
MIGSVPDNILNNNGLYMRLKVINKEQITEIANLKKQIVVLGKELDEVTVRCNTYRCFSS